MERSDIRDSINPTWARISLRSIRATVACLAQVTRMALRSCGLLGLLSLRRQDRDDLHFELIGRIGEPRNLQQGVARQRRLVREIAAAHLAIDGGVASASLMFSNTCTA